MNPFVLLLLGCRSPTPTTSESDTGEPAPSTAETADSGQPDSTADTAALPDVGQWAQWVTWSNPPDGQRSFGDVHILSTGPLKIAHAGEGFFNGDYLVESNAIVVDWPLGAHAFTNAGVSFFSTFGSATAVQLEPVGDVTGDAQSDLIATLNGVFVAPGPLDLNGNLSLPQTTWSVDEQTLLPGYRHRFCDVDDDGQNDFCNSRGIDLGPIDGTPELFWDPGVDAYDETLAIGQHSGATVAYVGTPGGVVRVPVAELLATPGEVDLGLHPTWPASDVSRLMPIDLDGDDTTELLSCARVNGLDRVWLHTDFPASPSELLALTNGCSDLEPGDFDGDGQLEVAIGHDSRVTVVELDGTVRYTHLGIVDPGFDGLGAGIDSADVDGDGRDDLIAGANRSRSLYLTLDAIPNP